MAIGRDGVVLRQLQTLFQVGTLGALTDGQLLERFTTGEGEAGELAFAVLVERHGPMVLRVCRGVLADPHEAQDAFQATFLVLVTKARGLRVRDSLAPWLYQVAYRTAKCARSSAARRARLERHAAMTRDAIALDDPGDESERVLHEEIERLPERYRAPLVLCDLEGFTHEQAARHLGWPIGTVKSRQSRGRRRLRDRLVRRGHAPGAGFWLAALKSSAIQTRVPSVLVDVTTRLAVHSLTARTTLPGSAAALAQEVLRSMSILRWWNAAAVLVALGATVSGAAVLAQKDHAAHKGTDARVVPDRDVPVATVKVGTFKKTVTAPGEVEPANNKVVVNQFEGLTTILSIRPEGSKVRANDLVCELDSSALRDSLTRQEITTRQAENTFETARITREAAEMALKEFVDGTFVQETIRLEGAITTAESAVRTAEARRERTREARDRVKSLLDARGADGLTPADILAELEIKNRLDDAEQDIQRATTAHKLARGSLDVLQKYTLARTRRELDARLRKERASERALKVALDQETNKETNLRRQIESCKLRAPMDGVIHYIHNGPGTTVINRQVLFNVYDPAGPMLVSAKISDPQSNPIQPGQSARITVKELDEAMDGVVKSVAPLPDPSNRFGKPLVTTVLIKLAPDSPRLAPGLLAKVEISGVEVNGPVSVPRTAVDRLGGAPRVAVQQPDGGFEWRNVKVSDSLSDPAWIISGLRKGDIVAEDASLLREEPPAEPAQPDGKPRPR